MGRRVPSVEPVLAGQPALYYFDQPPKMRAPAVWWHTGAGLIFVVIMSSERRI